MNAVHVLCITVLFSVFGHESQPTTHSCFCVW